MVLEALSREMAVRLQIGEKNSSSHGHLKQFQARQFGPGYGHRFLVFYDHFGKKKKFIMLEYPVGSFFRWGPSITVNATVVSALDDHAPTEEKLIITFEKKEDAFGVEGCLRLAGFTDVTPNDSIVIFGMRSLENFLELVNRYGFSVILKRPRTFENLGAEDEDIVNDYYGLNE